MFGYIRPVTTELKVRELDAFKSCYCGLCHVMGKKFGFISRFVLNYDFVFLTMLLWDKDTPIESESKRCLACPFKKKNCCKTTEAFEKSAALSIILSWWKIQDEISDERFFKRNFYKILALLFKRSYKAAIKEYKSFDDAVKQNLAELTTLEKDGCASIDATADCFAKILAAAAVTGVKQKDRILEQVLYHVGRWIYIIDAVDDFSQDIKRGRYNPVSARFDNADCIDANMENLLKTTIMHSRNLVGHAFELLDETPWGDTVRNIITLGMPGVTEAVFSGEWQKK